MGRACETGRIPRRRLPGPTTSTLGIAASVMEPKPPPSKKGFLKPKPQRNFVVFDVLAAKKKKKKPVKAPPKPKVVIQMPPPDSLPGKVRKKRLSSLKKRILLERQEKYYQAHPEMRPAASVREEVPREAFSDATGLEKRFVVRVENACTAPELEDDEEREEILRDVGDICSAYAQVAAVEVAATLYQMSSCPSTCRSRRPTRRTKLLSGCRSGSSVVWR